MKYKLGHFDRIELTVDEDEVPDGHSACKVFEDKDKNFYVAVGSSCSVYDKRIVVLAYYYDLGIELLGGETLYNELNKIEKTTWYNFILDYIFKQLANQQLSTKFVLEMLAIVHNKGFNEGAEVALSRVRNSLKWEDRQYKGSKYDTAEAD